MITVSANNGTAPADALAVLPGHNGDGSPHTAPHATAASYARIRAALGAAGLGELLPSDGWSCYRDRAAQQHMRDIGLTTIPVGQSIHGEWTHGSAADLANLGGFGAPRHEWLRHHGGEHGWYQPAWAQAHGSLPEPWHWEYDQRHDQHLNEEPIGGFLMALTDQEQANLYARIVNLDQQVTGADGFTPSVAGRVVNVDRQLTGADGLSPSLGSRIIHTDQQATGADGTSPSIAENVNDLERALTTTTTTMSSWAGAVAVILALAIAAGFVIAIARGSSLPDVALYALAGAVVGGLLTWLTARRS